jgi:hypothetical protein
MDDKAALTRLREFFEADPVLAVAIAAALVAFATTPIAFAVLGRLNWFQARRGRTLQRPSFASVVVGMMLVMGIPAIFSALALKSRYFDKDRYEFDPNKTWSVLEQGRGLRDLHEADEAVRQEMTLLSTERKNLVDNVKKLDEAMLALRAVAGTSPAVAQAVPNVLQRLAGVRRSVGVDAPQQLMDFTAPPVELANLPTGVSAPAVAIAAVAAPSAPAAPPASGLSKSQAEAELKDVPGPQKTLAALLPLADLPAGWTVGKSGAKHLETFNAENLFEKIDGRAESFVDFEVRGMAYTYYHPTGDESDEVQLYIFEFPNSLKSRGKFDTEKPDEAKELAVGAAGYTSAGSTLFYTGPYYIQIVSTKDDAKFSGFAVELAKRIAAQAQGSSAASASPGETAATKAKEVTPDTLFALLPEGSGKSGTKYVPKDVFGYSFLTDVFMADYQQDGITWQGFLRPYRDPKEARAVFDQYVENAKKDGATVETIETEGADAMVASSNIGLVDVFFVKGNAIGGANGATDRKPAEAFARSFAKVLALPVPAIESSPSAPSDGDGGEK